MKSISPALLLLLTINSPAFAAEEAIKLERLFTDRKTRAELDQARNQYSAERLEILANQQELEENVPAEVRMDGVVIRSNGSTEAWINGSSTLKGTGQELLNRPRSAGGNRFRVTLPGGEEVVLKPGQVYSLERQRVLEGYEAGKEFEPELIEEAVDTGTAENPQTAAPASAAAGEKPPAAAATAGAEFDESQLATPDSRIKLLEERLQKLEQQDVPVQPR
jgi:hypothetical protein